MNNDDFNNTLFVTDEDGNDLEIRVIDIVTKRRGLKKLEFIFYVQVDNPFEIYASYLNETRDSFSIDTIDNPTDKTFVNQYIEQLPIETIVDMARGDIPADEFIDMWLEHLESEDEEQ